MENKKLMFSEARFVFNGSDKPASKPKPAPVPAPTSMATPKLDVAKGTAAALTALKLQGLKSALAMSGFSLKGKSIEVDFGGSFVKDLSSKLEGLLKGKDNEDKVKRLLAITKGLGFTDKDALVTAARIYASDILIKSRAKFHDEYKDFETYLKDKRLKADDMKCKIGQDSKGDYTFEFTTKDPKVLTGHKEWWDKRDKEQKSKAKATAGKGKETVSSKELARFSKSPLGKIFKFLKGEDNKNWLQLMKAGKAPLAFFIAGLFGYKIGAEMYNGAVEILPDKFKGRMKRFERKARASKFSAAKYAKKHPKKTPAVDAAESLSAEDFVLAIKYNEIPKKGLKLTEDYVIKRGETLSVDLSGGGKLILPKEGKAYVNGELSDPGKTYEKTKIVLTQKIPKGTVILGKVSFKKNVPTKAAPAKTT